MRVILKHRPSPSMAVAMSALIVAVAGTAIAGPLAGKSVLSKQEKKQTKNIAKNQIQQLAPGLSVANANTATNAEAVDNVSQEALTVGRSGEDDSCNPAASGTFTDCVGVTFSLPRAGRVLMIATGGQVSTLGVADGECRFEVDEVASGNDVSPGEVATDNTGGSATNGFALTRVTGVLTAGSHTFELSCDEDVGDTGVANSMISALMIGSS